MPILNNWTSTTRPDSPILPQYWNFRSNMFSWSHQQQGELKDLPLSGNTMREYETGFPANRELKRQVMTCRLAFLSVRKPISCSFQVTWMFSGISTASSKKVYRYLYLINWHPYLIPFKVRLVNDLLASWTHNGLNDALFTFLTQLIGYMPIYNN